MELSLSASLGRRALSASLLAALVITVSCGEDPPTTGLPTPTANQVPVADAGVDQAVSVGLTVTLDGSGSTDADADVLSHSWSIASSPAGSAAALNDASAEDPSFVPDVAGTYTVQLVVTDGTDSSPADAVTITAEDNTTIEMIGAAGGTIASSDGMFGLAVPAGALTEDVEIRITSVPPSQFPSEFDGVDPSRLVLYDLQPSGLQFAAPAVVSLTISDAAIDEADSFGAELPLVFTLTEGATGLEAEVADDVSMEVARGESDITIEGGVTHFSRFGVVSGAFVVVADDVPSSVPEETPFDVTVIFLANILTTIETPPTQTDVSVAPVAPEAGFSGTFSVPDAGNSTSTNPYTCTEAGSGTYRIDVEAQYSLALDEEEEEELDAVIQLFLPSLVLESRVTLDADVDCTAPPPPPPETFTEVASPAGEAISVLHASTATTYGVAELDGLKIFNDDGTVLRDILMPASGFEALIGATGSTDAVGEGSIFGFGPDGVFGLDPAVANSLMWLDLSEAGVTDATTSITDAFFIENELGGPSTAGDRYAFAQFEDRNVLFAEDDGDGGLSIVPELADAFVQNGVSIFGADRPISLWIGPNGFDENNPMLVLSKADDPFGDLNIVSLEGGVAVRTIVPEFTSIIEPRRLRCDDATGICGISSFRTDSFGGIYTFRWDGQDDVTQLTPRLSFAPVGIDIINDGTSVFMTGTDTRRFFDGAFQYEFRIIEFGSNGAQLGSAAYVLPPECIDPFHALFRRRIPEFNEVLISCNGDAETEGRVISMPFTFPPG